MEVVHIVTEGLNANPFRYETDIPMENYELFLDGIKNCDPTVLQWTVDEYEDRTVFKCGNLVVTASVKHDN